jgi:hypothetical protein
MNEKKEKKKKKRREDTKCISGKKKDEMTNKIKTGLYVYVSQLGISDELKANSRENERQKLVLIVLFVAAHQ